MKPKYLYHGSGRELIGEKLVPKQADDFGGNKNNSLNGIYATSVKEQAISMALHSCKGVGSGSMQMHKINGKIKIKYSIIYKGWPKQKQIFLYIIPSKTFRNIPRGSPQWVSFKPVKPYKILTLRVKDYTHLIRKANKKEMKDFKKKYQHKI